MARAELDKRPQRGWRDLLPASALGMAAFFTQFDVTGVVVAMPAMAAELGFGVAAYAWVMDAYSLAFTGGLLAAGALADRYGRRRALLGGNIVFLAGSIACGVAAGGPELWAARAVQGLGAAFVVTGGIALLASTYARPDERARAFAIMGVISGVAMALGPTLGGLVSGWIGWRWIFLINIPLCLLVILGVPRLVAESRDPAGRPLDWSGVALLTLTLGIAIESLLMGRAAPAWIAVGLAASACLFAIFGIQQRRRAAPIFDPAVFGRPVIAGISALLVAVSIGYWAVLVYLPRFLGAAVGWTGSSVGVALLAATLPMLVLPPYGARLAKRWGWRRLFATAMLVLLAGDLTLVLAASGWLVNMDVILAAAAIGMLLIGLGAVLAHPQLSGAVVALVPPAQTGMASAVTVVMRQAGFALGIAALGATIPDEAMATGYMWPWLLAAFGSAGGLAAASLLLPGHQP
ncbi:MFS transporter permease [Bradyrhizobium sacchari]|uniref:Putative MFS family arabinose efflux permease n=1 Tax=Bradyrhizobium sacchari TaxID=1399419 RepID=A0A560JXT3_9BRAD|nr:MFS transporter [Bradyrhizobium sacchari]OPY94777.1 MFS transporter permease [Bradyrhizobium sacchari]TWB59797.1 putative MFS family arabinose efflux permease [Bradyrhizobium sacchari]TWB74394.1 putative MFS family arabinose efflux permease [Bradyrhizobium sacchari]